MRAGRDRFGPGRPEPIDSWVKPGQTAAPAQGARLDRWLTARAWLILTVLIAGYTVLFTGLNIYRMQALRQGFDFLVYEQPIWNTVQGRPFAQSMYAFATTHLGVDLALFELWIVPFYALWQSPVTLFVLISLGAGLGAWPLFLIARRRYASAPAGIAWAVLYLVFFPVGTITVAEFQPRLFAATALLGAYWFYQTRRPLAFWLCLAIAITVRSDVGLVVGCFGLLGLLERRSPAYGLAPLLAGFTYWASAVFIIIPALASGHSFLWLDNYAWLGSDARQILATIVMHPLYTAQGVLTLEKFRYLAQLLWPLAFLPLLAPRLLLPALPIFALNLLSGELVQFDLYHQYQALIIPFLFLAALHGLADVLEAPRERRRRLVTVLLVAAVAAATVLLPWWPGNAESRNGLNPKRQVLVFVTLLGLCGVPAALGFWASRATRQGARVLAPVFTALFGLVLLQHLVLGSEIIRFLKDPRPSPRLAVARRGIALIPPEAPLAVTSQLGIHVPLRQRLYHFPGNDSYDPRLVDQAEWVLADRLRDPPRERAAVERLLQDGGGRWRVVWEEGDFVLLRRDR